MTLAILSIGTELVRGEIHNSNATWLCERATSLGITVNRCETIADDPEQIAETLRRMAKESKLIISTGGLGPTTDDLTAFSVARCLGAPLQRDSQSLETIRQQILKRGRVLTESNAKQADFPEGATVLANAWGTAPGFSVRLGETLAIFLPGVPREMKPMFERYVEAEVTSRIEQSMYQVRIKTFGAPESKVNDLLAGVEEQFDVNLGYRAHFPEIEVKALALRESHDAAKNAAHAAADAIKQRLGSIVYGEGTLEFPQAVGQLLIQRGYTLGLAESCTGGLVSELITQHAASAFYKGTIVSYCNDVKNQQLGVSSASLEQHGAVSEAVAREMATGAKTALHADVSLSLTGIAGPTGGSEHKPVGLVHYAVSTPKTTVCQHQVFAGDRAQIRLRAAFAGLELLRQTLLTEGS